MAFLAPFTEEETEGQRGGVWLVQGRTSSDREETLVAPSPGLLRTSEWEDTGKEERMCAHRIPLDLLPKLPLANKEIQMKTEWRYHLQCSCFISRSWSLLGGKD